MDSILSLISVVVSTKPEIAIVVTALFAVSEALSLIPKVKSNGVFQLIANIIRKVAKKD